jgi:hypothetical protein
MTEITGRRIIADCGYGVGGAADSNCLAWNSKTNIDARMDDGVIALTQGTFLFKYFVKN